MMNIKQVTIQQMAQIIGLALGSAMLLIVSAAFLLGHAFGLGGVTLTLVGTLLLGLSIWRSVQISVSPEGFAARFECLEEEVRSNTVGVVNEMTEFKREIRTSIVEAVSPEISEKLKLREKVDKLIEQGEFEEALKLDPRNTIALTRLIKKLVKKGQFRRASELYPELKEANMSGVGYSVYPQLALAFEKEGNATQAQRILNELEEAIQRDLARGYGYLSRSQQIKWVLRDIQKVIEEVNDSTVATRLKELDTSLEGIIDALTRG